jgi:hypothetical protein
VPRKSKKVGSTTSPANHRPKLQKEDGTPNPMAAAFSQANKLEINSTVTTTQDCINTPSCPH